MPDIVGTNVHLRDGTPYVKYMLTWALWWHAYSNRLPDRSVHLIYQATTKNVKCNTYNKSSATEVTMSESVTPIVWFVGQDETSKVENMQFGVILCDRFGLQSFTTMNCLSLALWTDLVFNCNVSSSLFPTLPSKTLPVPPRASSKREVLLPQSHWQLTVSCQTPCVIQTDWQSQDHLQLWSMPWNSSDMLSWVSVIQFNCSCLRLVACLSWEEQRNDMCGLIFPDPDLKAC